MQTKVTCTEIFCCSKERAFKAPILGDATRFLNGYRFQPPITGFEDDSTWGQVNGMRYPVTNGSLLMPAGVFMADKILERKENKYWKWTIYDIKPWSLFYLQRAMGEWQVESISENEHEVSYSYTWHSSNLFFYLCVQLFCIVQWKGMMEQAMQGIKEQAESNEVFVYECRP